MSEPETDLLTQPETQDNPDLRALRQKADQADQLGKELAELRRKDAFRDAGLDPTNRQHAIYMKAYDGDLEPTKIRQQATDDGFLGDPAPPAAQASPEEQAGFGRIGEATAGGGAPGAVSHDVRLADLSAQAQRERWAPEQLTAAIANYLSGAGYPTAFDGL